MILSLFENEREVHLFDLVLRLNEMGPSKLLFAVQTTCPRQIVNILDLNIPYLNSRCKLQIPFLTFVLFHGNSNAQKIIKITTNVIAIWAINHALWLCHETMVGAACLGIFL